MSDSERVRELETKLRAWRWGALALAGTALLTATAGVTVAQTGKSDLPDSAVPSRSIVLELPVWKELTIDAKEIAHDAPTNTYNLTGGFYLKWGAGYSLGVGSGYVANLKPVRKNSPTLITLTPAP